MAEWYRVLPNAIINLDDVSSVQLNADGKGGWVRMKTLLGHQDRRVVYPITSDQFEELVEKLCPGEKGPGRKQGRAKTRSGRDLSWNKEED